LEGASKMKNWTMCIIASIVCRLLAIVAVLAFVYFMVVLTGSLSCLWLLFLLLAVELVPAYEFKSNNSKDEENKND
jgi:membrane protein YdbS with pleckstrin-like domain